MCLQGAFLLVFVFENAFQLVNSDFTLWMCVYLVNIGKITKQLAGLLVILLVNGSETPSGQLISLHC